MAALTMKVEVWEIPPPAGGKARPGRRVNRFSVTGATKPGLMVEALKKADTGGRPAKASFARFGGGSGPPDGIMVSYHLEAAPAA